MHRVAWFLCLSIALVRSAVGAGATDRSDSVSVGPVGAVVDATRLAQQHSGAQVARVVGDSMVPFFSGGDVVVFKRIAFHQVRVGMIAVYENAWGETVAHQIVKVEPQGLITRGYHNREADSTRVTSDNFRGIVYGTFHAYDNGVVASDLQSIELFRETAVVLAAPAK
ncbi:MAG TPA: signal peptidase I [Opitutaceae bacterium]|nr:signal peptidase I [Opitutaceae bacterium]